jgi:hypothetical protein
MPMNAAQMAALVERAKAKAPPVVTSPPAPPTPRRKLSDNPSKAPKPVAEATAQNPPTIEQAPAAVVPPLLPSPAPEAAEADDFPVGWELRKESWQFHRRFYAIFRRPMHRGEYSHLLWQIRHRKAEHLLDDCWRVTLPGGRTLPVRGNVWKLITILPKHWQPPQVAAQPETVSG